MTISLRMLVVLLLAEALLASPIKAQVPGLPIVDFDRYFPHLVAVSQEMHVKGIAGSIQYKFIEIRDEQQHVVIVALTRHDSLKDGFEIVFVARGPIENSEAALRKTVDGFSKKENVQFEFVDLRDVKTLEEFKLRATALGWGIQAQPQ
jgi:hypothetical protein